jgi:hypothetical protein
MLRSIAFGMLILGSIGKPSAAVASICFEPRAPTVYLRKPSKPFCAAMHSCTEFDVSSYKRDIERYFRDLQQYLDDVGRYRREANEYVECMSKLD